MIQYTYKDLSSEYSLKYNINMVDDLFRILDQYVDGVAGDKFYMERKYKTPFKNHKRFTKRSVIFVVTISNMTVVILLRNS